MTFINESESFVNKYTVKGIFTEKRILRLDKILHKEYNELTNSELQIKAVVNMKYLFNKVKANYCSMQLL